MAAISLDRQRIRLALRRAAAGLDAADFLNREILDRLLERLEAVQIQPKIILDLGTGTGQSAAKLGTHFSHAQIIALDFVAPMLQIAARQKFNHSRATWICADMSDLPVKDNCIDLIFSNLTLQFSPDPFPIFLEAQRVMGYPGLFVFTTLGPDSFRELRDAWAQVDHYSHVSTFIDMHNLGDALIQAGFVEPVVDNELVTVTYESLARLFAELRSAGSINATPERNRGLTGRKGWQRMSDAYEQQRDKLGRLPVTMEIIYGLAWSGGSGTNTRTRPDEFEFPISDLGTSARDGT